MLYTVSSNSKNTFYPPTVLMLISLACTITWHAEYLVTHWYIITLCLCIFFLIKHARSSTYIFFHLLLLGTTCVTGIYRYNYYINQAEALYKTIGNRSCSIHAYVASIEHTPKERFPYIITLVTQQTQTDATWQSNQHTIRTYTKHQPSIDVADTVELKNIKIRKPKNKDFFQYLIKEGVAGTCFLTSEKFILVERPTHSLTRFIHTLRSQLLKHFNTILTPAAAVLFRSIFMGKRSNKDNQMKKLKQSCLSWGVSHHLARSGLHLIIIVLAWQLLLKLFIFSLYKRTVIVVILSIIYQLLTWPSISFFRALWAFLLNHICMFFCIPTNSFYLLILIALLTLLKNPFLLFFLDFQLSFGTALALTWYNTISSTSQPLTTGPTTNP